MDLKDRRRALYTVLNDYLEGDALWSALVHWEESYSHQPVFPWKLISEILSTPELSAKRLELHRALVQVHHRPTSELLPDPGGQMENFRARMARKTPGERARAPTPTEPGSTALKGDPASIACTKLVVVLFRGVDAVARGELHRFVLHELPRSRLPKASRQRILAWFSGSDKRLSDLPLGDLRRLVNMVYMGLCEAVGPSAADGLLAAAVARLVKEESPEIAKAVKSLL